MKLSEIIEQIVASDPDFEFCFIMRKGDEIVVKGNSHTTSDSMLLAMDGVGTLASILARDGGIQTQEIIDLACTYLQENFETLKDSKRVGVQ